MYSQSLSDRVERLLRDEPETRESDLLLIFRVWEQDGQVIPAELKQAVTSGRVSSFETIRRTRQKLQENGAYKATEPTRRARAYKASAMRRDMPEIKAPIVDNSPKIIPVFGTKLRNQKLF